MSSYKKRQKTLKRTHRERGQVHSRLHLGILEKHKDYVLRARDYHKKKEQLKVMHEKARNRNPDEFYYKMIKTKLKDGCHMIPHDLQQYSHEELQLMKTQDEKYIHMKLATEGKKIERLRSCLHETKLSERQPPNTHTIFVDSVEEVSSRAVELSNRKVRKPAPGSSEEGMKRTHYKELKQRIQRYRQLRKVAMKVKTQKDLMGKGRCIKIKGSGTVPVTYKWKMERQK